MADNKGLTNLEENRFWLQIFGDQGDILSSSIDLKDKNSIVQSKEFSDRFYGLYERARQRNFTDEQMSQLNQDALKNTLEWKQFVFGILQKQLFEKYYISLLPVYVNSYINKANMYLYILGEFMQNRQLTFQKTYFLRFWLPIITSYTYQLESGVGIYFSSYREQARRFIDIFSGEYLRVDTNMSILENGIKDFPINTQVALDVYENIHSYAEFLVDTMVLIEQKKLPSALSQIFPDHLYRILCYVTTHLSFMLGKSRPACDPGAPRYSLVKA